MHPNRTTPLLKEALKAWGRKPLQCPMAGPLLGLEAAPVPVSVWSHRTLMAHQINAALSRVLQQLTQSPGKEPAQVR